MHVAASFVLASYASFALRMWNAKVSTHQYSPRSVAHAASPRALRVRGWHGIPQHKQCKYMCAAGVARAANGDEDS